MSRMMPDCKETHRLLSEGMDRELRLSERMRARLHLTMCAACSNFLDQMTLIRMAVRKFPGPGDHDGGHPR